MNTRQEQRELVHVLARHSALDPQSWLALLVLLDAREQGNVGRGLAAEIESVMLAHRAEVKVSRAAAIR